MTAITLKFNVMLKNELVDRIAIGDICKAFNQSS